MDDGRYIVTDIARERKCAMMEGSDGVTACGVGQQGIAGAHVNDKSVYRRRGRHRRRRAVPPSV